MRLLNTNHLCFREFLEYEVPEYAILSHRWIGEEVSFHEFNDPDVQQSGRFSKILNCRSLARSQGYQWVWIDTCCIDKKSSAELSEAINSMFDWYRNASVCYVYLADVPSALSFAQFRQSAWFTRGWTLQELLAPAYLLFLDCHWCSIGSLSRLPHDQARYDDTDPLLNEISSATRISTNDLLSVYYPHFLAELSVAKNMSWLAGRYTSRKEDLAYCMLGLCRVNMPLLYGEGYKAFQRLQMEIIRTSDDESIFAWFGDLAKGLYGVLAPAPQAFSKSGQVVRHKPMFGKKPYAMTNKGLQYEVPHKESWVINKDIGAEFNLLLDCGLADQQESTNARSSIVLRLRWDGAYWRRVITLDIPMQDKADWEYEAQGGCIYDTFYLSTDNILSPA